jgi:hypothetical protein
MISLKTARKLKKAGLIWMPQPLDAFGLPDRHMDDRVFVISDMLVTVDMLQGMQVVSFQGASEWALDYLVTTEAVWIPHEEQLRLALEAALIAAGSLDLRLSSGLQVYRCDFHFKGQALTFERSDVSELYAAALLHVLTENKKSSGSQN